MVDFSPIYAIILLNKTYLITFNKRGFDMATKRTKKQLVRTLLIELADNTEAVGSIDTRLILSKDEKTKEILKNALVIRRDNVNRIWKLLEKLNVI